MKSTKLSDFSEWEDWSETAAAKAPSQPGIYAFRLKGGTVIARVKGDSDIVYMGSTTRGKSTLRARLKQHLRPREDEVDLGYRLKRIEKEVSLLQIAWMSFNTHDEAKPREAELLGEYIQDHIELPPLNRQESGKKIQCLIKRLKRLPPDQRDEIVTAFGQGEASAPPKSKC